MLTKQFWKLLSRNRVHNVPGTLKTGGSDGNVLGGMLLIGAGNTGVVASWKEETFADFGDLADGEASLSFVCNSAELMVLDR